MGEGEWEDKKFWEVVGQGIGKRGGFREDAERSRGQQPFDSDSRTVWTNMRAAFAVTTPERGGSAPLSGSWTDALTAPALQTGTLTGRDSGIRTGIRAGTGRAKGTGTQTGMGILAGTDMGTGILAGPGMGLVTVMPSVMAMDSRSVTAMVSARATPLVMRLVMRLVTPWVMDSRSVRATAMRWARVTVMPSAMAMAMATGSG